MENRSKTRYPANTLSFNRMGNFSDGVFAIVLTLLVFDIGVPDPLPESLPDLFSTTTGLLSFGLSFVVIVFFWMQHHGLFAALKAIEPVFMALNLLMLGLIALIPFTTALLSAGSASSFSVVAPYIGLLAAINVSQYLLVVRMHQADLMAEPLSRRGFICVSLCYGSWVAIFALAIVIALFSPILALISLATGMLTDHLIAARAPADAQKLI